MAPAADAPAPVDDAPPRSGAAHTAVDTRPLTVTTFQPWFQPSFHTKSNGHAARPQGDDHVCNIAAGLSASAARQAAGAASELGCDGARDAARRRSW